MRIDRPLRERVIAPAAVALPVQRGARIGVLRVYSGRRLVARRITVRSSSGSGEKSSWPVKLATTAFVSSNCWDALGAKSFGFRVYWINRLQAPVDGLGFEPDAILKSLGDLPEILQ